MAQSEDNTTSKRPYLIRAMHEWMSDNGHTPHIVVDASGSDVRVPAEHVKDGRIILNVSFSAAHNLRLDNDTVSFQARFSGSPFDVVAPVSAILGIYARETGQGMIFSEADGTDPEPPSDDGSGQGGAPHLKVVK